MSAIKVNNPEMTVSFVSLVLYFTCIKKSTTNVAFVHAIARADAQVNVRCPDSQCRAHKQSQDNDQVDQWADNVVLVFFVMRLLLGHAVLLLLAHAVASFTGVC
jgi:hypothetical protein